MSAATCSNPAATPVPVHDDQGDGRWMSMHNRFLREAKKMSSGCEVLFIGDSIIFGLEDTEVWETQFKQFGSLNFGIGGDTTENVLWRIQNDTLDHIRPKVVVLLVGTNNVARCPTHTAANIAEGIEAIVWYINGISSEIRTLVLGILPRGENPNPLRVKIRDINSQLESTLANIPNTRFLNADPGFVGRDEKISADDMRDYVHPTRVGYTKMCKLIYEAIVKLIRYS